MNVTNEARRLARDLNVLLHNISVGSDSGLGQDSAVIQDKLGKVTPTDINNNMNTDEFLELARTFSTMDANQFKIIHLNLLEMQLEQ